MKTALRAPHAVDAALLSVLGTVALYGFRDTYYGSGYLVAGVIGLLLGVALATLTRQLGQPRVVLVVAIVAVFFLLGGLVALHGLGGRNLFPVPHTIDLLASCTVHGWKQLLTTLPPVDGGPLLTLPYLLGLVAGAAGVALADVRWAPAPVLVPIALLALVNLLGVKNPRHTAVTAAMFAALVIVWLVLRAGRRRIRITTESRRLLLRRATAVALCGGVALVSLVAGPKLPGLRDDRVVLRSHVTPPFDVGQYPSPLAEFRRFTKGYASVQPADALYDKPLFKVSPPLVGTPLRIAALDSYDGNVWGAGNVAGSVVDPQTDADDTFQKVGRIIDNPVAGKPLTGTVTILDGTADPGSSSMDVWLPTAGDLTGITFSHHDQEQASDDFRYNLSSSTGVLPEGLAKDDTYTFTGVEPDQKLTSRTRLAPGSLPEVDASTFQRIATTWAGRAPNQLAQVKAVAAYLYRHGHYTDGEKGFQFYPAGDSLYRLNFFTSATGQLAGNDEQFAAMMALAANALGVPARVVMGATPEPDGIVRGKDISAWVELQAADGSWKTLPAHDFMNRTRKPQRQHLESQRSIAATNIPPPAPVHPPSTSGQPLDNSLNHRTTAAQGHRFKLPDFVWVLLKYVVLPLLIVAILCGSIIETKRVRRARRRSRGTSARQLALAWQELLDHARDYGVGATTGATRREQAAELRRLASWLPDLAPSARRADAVMFGRPEPTLGDVSEFWSEVDGLRERITSVGTRRQRVRAALSLATFRPSGVPTPKLGPRRRRGPQSMEGALGT